MKRLASLVCIAFVVMVVASGCKKTEPSADTDPKPETKSNPYAGTYVGTLSSVTEKYQKDSLKMVFVPGLLDKTNLLLYGFPLTKITEVKYEAKGELVITIIQLVTPGAKSENIENASVEFTFSTGKVNMNATYNVLGVADVSVIKYEGVKQQ